LSNSLIDSLEDGEEQSFEEREIGSENRWINAGFGHQQGLNESHHQSFSDTHGRIKGFKPKLNKDVPKEHLADGDYLDCDLASFGVSNQQQSINKDTKLTEKSKPSQSSTEPTLPAEASTIQHVLSALS
jgi:hypothetical protein